jgi:hypothetical protein
MNKRILVVIVLSAFATWAGSGCKNVKEIDISLTGFEAEYYPATPEQDTGGVFGSKTNTPQAVPVAYPRLMPLNRER